MATTKKEGWTGSIRQWGNGVHSQEVICSEDPPFLDRRTYKAATVVIHEGDCERVFTESEVRAALRDAMAIGFTRDEKCNILKEVHGIVLDPA
jgi:hypothetical protein